MLAPALVFEFIMGHGPGRGLTTAHAHKSTHAQYTHYGDSDISILLCDGCACGECMTVCNKGSSTIGNEADWRVNYSLQAN